MNLDQFFQHWRISENPFRGEEARHDAVFARMSRLNGTNQADPDAATPPGDQIRAVHSDFEKIVGSLDQLSTAVVFGEKGSGKTAIRLQITQHVEDHNATNPEGKVFLIAYDDLNGFLDRLHDQLGGKDPDKTLEKIRLVDHIDAILTLAVAELGRQVLGAGNAPSDPQTKRTMRRAPKSVRSDLLLLHAVYARGGPAADRTAKLRRALRLSRPRRDLITLGLTLVGWLPAAAVFYFGGFLDDPKPEMTTVLTWVIVGLGAAWLVPLAKWLSWDRLVAKRVGRRLRRQIRISNRSDSSFGISLSQLPRPLWSANLIPLGDADEPRYEMLSRLGWVVDALGYKGVMVLVDRVDEPTLISGDAKRMQAVIWPMLNNKFLQQETIALKMLLPIELRYALFRESSAFFQEARLDKQNLVERLSWTGATLYDLCEARLAACRDEGTEPIALLDLFSEDVTRRDVVDALDQMHQPRDAFKFLYQCITEHCSNVTAEEGEWRVPRLVLELVKKQQSDRVQALYRGIRPG